MQVLHLIDPSAPPAAAALLDLLRQPADPVWALGTSWPGADRQLPCPWATHPSAWLSLRRAVRRQPNLAMIHALSIRGAAIAGALRSGLPVLATITHTCDLPSASTSERRSLRSGHWFAATGPAVRLSLTAAGAPPDRIVELELPLFPRQPRPVSRAHLRARWAVAPSTFLVAALGDPPSRVDALEALMGVGLARETGRDTRLLISPRATGLDRAQRVVASVHRGPTMIVTHNLDRPWECLHACDAALVLANGPSGLCAMAAALPIVAPDTPALREHLTHDQTALLCPPHKAALFARQVCTIFDDPARARALGQQALRHCTERYPGQDFVRNWRAIRDRVLAHGNSEHQI